MKAYPHTKHFSDYHDNDNMNGMDLRDYFAGRIVPVMLKNLYDIDDYIVDYGDYDAIAADSYRVADAMMKARDGK